MLVSAVKRRNIMFNKIKNPAYFEEAEEFGKFSWIKPALVMGGIAASIYGLILAAPHILETIQAVFLFLMFFGMLS